MRNKITQLLIFWLVLPAIAAAQARISKAELGTGVTDKFEITGATTEFKPDIPRIYCSWKVEGAKAGTPVRGVWIAEDVGKVAPPNYKIDEVTFRPPVGAPDHGSFALNKPNIGFPVGKYRLEIYLGGTLAKTIPFTVKAK
jgi:hypothetical protein